MSEHINKFRLPTPDEAIIQISFRGKANHDGIQHDFKVGIGLHNVSQNEMAAVIAMSLPGLLKELSKQMGYGIVGKIDVEMFDDIADDIGNASDGGQ